ncbi:3-keto-5-aminohexanoate cleavage protein [Piscinibacter sp. XHJ-5]|uniref:3-keto-5-aminohexanoate cleavage protein n=1 Tax=Piscinibacter sp. XHJ-5 TaxID=3037797 RepID=UPI0024530715|nr:3-keto-5-aminohexanoate cleavage protein [Piscinibacter sp. XHJ-5]
MSSPNTSNRGGGPVVVCVAPNGARRTHGDHPALPMRPHEIAVEAAACADAGASVIHLHVRDADGGHSLDARRYRDAMAEIRSAVADRLLIQVTTESVGRYSPQQQIALLHELRPEAASVALRELVPHESAVSKAAWFFEWAQREGVALQYIVYDADEARRLVSWVRAGIVPHAAPNALFVLGRYTAGQQSAPSQLLPFLQEWPPEWPWSLCAFGPSEALCMAAAIGLGGHARVGFENNLHLPDGTLAARNADLVANVADIARRSGRGTASAAVARQIYGDSRG